MSTALTLVEGSLPAPDREEGDRLPNGAKRLKKLSGKHHKIISYHLAGMKGEDIARLLGMTQPRISVILNDPLVLEEIKRRVRDYDQEFNALFPKAIDVLRTKLDSGDPAVALKAVDITFRAQGRYEKKGNAERVSAEDVVAKMLEMSERTGQPVTIGVKVGNSE